MAEKKHIEDRLWFEKHESLAWKTRREVNCKLQRVEGKTNAIKELKLQINIRVKGLGSDESPTPFSKNGRQKTV